MSSGEPTGWPPAWAGRWDRASKNLGSWPRLPTWALQQLGSYMGYNGRDADILAKAAVDPFRNFTAHKISRE